MFALQEASRDAHSCNVSLINIYKEVPFERIQQVGEVMGYHNYVPDGHNVHSLVNVS
jgi:hypothetical protein